MTMNPPGAAHEEDVIALVRRVHDRVLEKAPNMTGSEVTDELMAAVEQVVRVEYEINQLAGDGDIDRAFESLAQIDTTSAPVEIEGATWNQLCWHGALWGQAERALPACEAAVALDSTNLAWLDSRGLARALAGDTDDAIADFARVVDGTVGEFRAERNEWLEALKTGANPFTEEVLEGLRGN